MFGFKKTLITKKKYIKKIIFFIFDYNIKKKSNIIKIN